MIHFKISKSLILASGIALVGCGRSSSSAGRINFAQESDAAISEIIPAMGTLQGGDRIEIHGSKFLDNSTATIGGLECLKSVLTRALETTASTLTCFTPPHEAGLVDVLLTAPGGSELLFEKAYEFRNAPTLATITPSSGPLQGGTVVTVAGTFFSEGVIVLIDDLPCTSLFRISATELTCSTPQRGREGPTLAKVISQEGQIAILNPGFTFLGAAANATVVGAPTIATVAPANGPMVGGVLITLTGQNLAKGALITVGGNACLNPNVGSDTTMTCRTPAAAAGTYDIVVTNPDGRTASLAASFVVLGVTAPSISFVAPNNGPIEGNTAVQIIGSGFTASSVVTIAGVSCTQSFVSASQLSCVTPKGSYGGKTVTVTNNDYQAGSLANGFIYSNGFAPQISSVIPGFGPVAGGTTVAINGSGFQTGANITIGGLQCNNVTFISSRQLSCSTPPGAYGTRNIIVLNPDALSSAGVPFIYSYGMAPSISSVSPNVGLLAGGTLLAIKGSGFAPDATVTIGGLTCANISVVSSSEISCVTPAGSFGGKIMVVTNADGQGSGNFANGFSFVAGPAPTLISVLPTFGPTGGGTMITLNGSGFLASAVVTVAGQSCTAVNVISSTQLSCLTPEGSYGAKPVIVTNHDAQTVTLANGFNYALGLPPTIFTVSPNNGLLAGGTIVTVTGTNFVVNSQIRINGIPCTTVTFNSVTSLGCTTPAGAYGAKAVLVIGPDNQTATLASGFTYNAGMAPVITSVMPVSGTTAGGNTLTVWGSNFFSDANVTVGGIYCDTVVVVSARQLTCTVPAGSIGAKTVLVTNPDNQTSGTTGAALYSYSLTGSYAFALSGGEDDARFGTALQSLSDITSDGKAEFAISEPWAAVTATANAGKVYVYNGATGALLCRILAPVATLNGNLGLAMAAGDVNADGTKDLVVAESGATAGGFLLAGKVHIYSGVDIAACAGGTLSSVLRSHEALAPETNAQFGWSVAVGSINTAVDANQDIIIGEPYAAGGGIQRGRVSLFSGATGAALFSVLNSPGTQDGASFGFAVAAVDMDADGKADVIVGEPRFNGAGTNRGRVLGYSGIDGTTTLFTAPTCTAATDGQCGFSLSSAGRVNGDARNDLLVGEAGNSRVYVYSLMSGVTLVTLWSPSGTASTYHGYSVAGAGDIDADGRDDFIVGAPNGAGGGTARGVATVYSGFTGLALFSFNGSENFSYLGRAVNSIGDVDGDGYPDLMFGEPGANNAGVNRGRGFVFLSP